MGVEEADAYLVGRITVRCVMGNLVGQKGQIPQLCLFQKEKGVQMEK